MIYEENIETINISNANELSLLIESIFNIPVSYQLIKLNDKILQNVNQLKHNDLIYIYIKERHSLISILGNYNHYTFKLVIDSGAQSNVISAYLANLLNLTIDQRTRGTAKGVGSAKILGTASCHMKINHQYYDMSFQVMETDVKDLTSKYLVLMGLDFLMSYDCQLSFKNKTLTIRDEITSFLNEHELNQYTHPVKEINPIEIKYKQLNLSLDEHIMLKKILNNIIANPYDDKYKLINVNSVTFQKHLSKHTGFMKEIGFVEMDKQLKYTNDINTLSNLIEIM